MVGHESWPWPQPASATPAGKKWWPTLKTSGTIARRVKRLEILGDLAVLGAIGFFAIKAYTNDYQTRKCSLTGQPPALVAQEYDFSDASANRTVDRAALQEYKDGLAAARKAGSVGDDVAWKY
eukprot:TRINITY_DN2150_c0_g2_i1.p1 TRINITY_DN2150_c0_g2~~TRINITY_DN2150_c0_g2_i1.p1  ORF type:complete len:139 (+),score=59.07 TRINITY_DN2150_c0_g2_i1:50-418(+)